MRNVEIKTPETHPDHQVVGKDFMAWSDGHRYYCDSYDPRIGFWMTRVDAPPERWNDDHSEYRRNVSERAIDRGFNTIHVDYENGKVREWVSGGKVKPRPAGGVGEAVYNEKFYRNWHHVLDKEAAQ